ncbi:unnamed protein product [Brassica oleracea]|uniref:(rape) hypothetical protein n=1 Tax=Brassica napus TaxID=3708 RepID=A0A816RM86_BRANA|nr:unnamed protein product [Brassica napus]
MCVCLRFCITKQHNGSLERKKFTMWSSSFAIFCLFSLVSLQECTNVKGIEISKLNFPLCSESTCPSKDREDCFLLFSCKKIEKCYCCNINGHNKYCSSNKAHCERRCKHRA